MPQASPAVHPVEHDTSIAWPNGGGETPCTSEYLEAFEAEREHERLAYMAEDDQDWSAYRGHLARAENAREWLLALEKAGHKGEPQPFDKPCPFTALLGGATMTMQGDVYNGEHFVGNLAQG